MKTFLLILLCLATSVAATAQDLSPRKPSWDAVASPVEAMQRISESPAATPQRIWLETTLRESEAMTAQPIMPKKHHLTDAASSPKQRSPLLAAAFSLALPGAGEFYSENYVRAAIFFAIEVGSWAYYFTEYSKAIQAEKNYIAFANQHYSAVQYANAFNIVYGYNIDLTRVANKDYSQLNYYEGISLLPTGNVFSHVLPGYGTESYYELIAKYETFAPGWDDFNTSLITSGNLNAFVGNSTPVQLQYSQWHGNANFMFHYASTALSIAVANHILSAIDALLVTNSYNNRITAHVEVGRDPLTQGLAPKAALQVKF